MPTAPIEQKVKSAAAASYLGSAALLTILTGIQSDPGLVTWLPPYVAPFVLSLVPTAVTFVAGYQAAHTPRTPTVEAPSGPPTTPPTAPPTNPDKAL